MYQKLTKVSVLYVTLLFSSFVSAVPFGISVTQVTPSNSGALFVAETAADNPNNAATFQLKADFSIQNTSLMNQTVSSVTVSYPGSGIANLTYTPQQFSNNVGSNFVANANSTTTVPVFDGLARDLPTPLPATVQIQIFFSGDPFPLQQTFNLAFYRNSTNLNAFFFPAKLSDLPSGQYWGWGTRHVVDSGGGGGLPNPTFGSQRFALDMGVYRWDGSTWTTLVNGAPNALADRDNSDYLVWNTPIYAVADGTIVSCYRGEPDHDPDTFANVTWENGGGNALTIQHGDELVSYFHNKEGSIPIELCPNDGQNNNLSIAVTAGQYLARIGNTGRSTNPHLHIQSVHATDNNLGGLPLNFTNIRTLGDDSSLTNLGETPSLQPLYGSTLHRTALVSPNPCGFTPPEAGFAEVSYHGVTANCYQDMFNMAVSRGYQPVFTDGYDVDGDTFFNVTFRTGGPTWVARHGLTGTAYQELFDDLIADGFRLQQVDSYLQNGNVRYTALFEKRQGPQFAAFHGLSDVDYDAKFTELADAGFVPINISTVEVGGDTFWTGLWEKLSVNGWVVQTVPAADYQDIFDENVNAGRNLIYVHGFLINGWSYLTGIWVDPVNPSFSASHGATRTDYQTLFEDNLAAGRLTRYTTGYDNSFGSPRFAAIWRARPNTSITGQPNILTNQDSAQFTFTSNVPFATFSCRLNGGLYSSCDNGTFQASGLTDGINTFEVFSRDRDHRRDLSPASFSWTVDTTPPDVTIVAPIPLSITVHGTVVDDPVEMTTVVGYANIVATASDSLSGVQSVMFKVNGVMIPEADVVHDDEDETWTYLFDPDINGSNVYTIEVTATDNANNSAATSIQVIGVKTGNKP